MEQETKDNLHTKTQDATGYKRLVVYQKAYMLSLNIYHTTRSFPKEELFGLTSQMRRCAVSVAANIVEGYGRRTSADKLQFYFISRGSLNELEYHIDLAHDLNYLPLQERRKLQELRGDVGRLLNGFMRTVS
ncbi:MAG: four helix bundle protein [Candidatus Sungbacteria bacterium]|nr:four helix bundle protein [Candidatus Sungbacteria bacterium]